ncbi:MAG: HAMP domain-containing histidine kinase [Oscillospiraceae bacterium]|nr:HAMP domain-containing histidine kinase [Oscillospiraceae bacterium]
MKFASKMILLVTALLAVSLALGGWAVVSAAFHGELDAAVDSAQEEMKLFGMTLQALCLRRSAAESPEAAVLEVLREYPALQNYEYRIYDSADTPLAGTARELKGQLTEQDVGVIDSRLLRTENGVWIHTSQRLLLYGRGFGLERWREITALFDRAEENLKRCELVMALILAVGTALTVTFTLLATRPIRRISRTAKQLSGGRYEKRVSVSGNDELSQLARDFNAMADALEQKIRDLEDAARRQRDFTAGFAHELKTPLTSVIGYADTLRSRELPRSRQVEAAGWIFSEGRRLESMSLALLDLFALEREAPVMQESSAARLAAEAAESAAPLLDAAGLRLETTLEDRTLRVSPALIRTALYNLIDNARKASPAGSVILLRGRAEGSLYRFDVIDRGRGIPAEALARITEPFYMVDKSRARAQGGAGLGLSLCQRIAEAHGGRLEFQSREGMGTTASLLLGGGAK